MSSEKKIDYLVKRLRGVTRDRYPGFTNLYCEAAEALEILAAEVWAARAILFPGGAHTLARPDGLGGPDHEAYAAARARTDARLTLGEE